MTLAAETHLLVARLIFVCTLVGVFVCVDPVASLCYYNAHLCFYFGTPAPVAVRSHGTHVGMAASLHHAPAPLLHLVVLVALVLLVTTLRVEVHPVHCLHVLPQRARVRVTLCASRRLAHVRFLGRRGELMARLSNTDVLTWVSLTEVAES